MTTLEPAEEIVLARAITLSHQARAHGNHPFGAILAGRDDSILLEAENTVVTEQDVTGHAETNLVRRTGRALGLDAFDGATLYTSCEPCAMCSGAIYWAGIARVVYAMSELDLAEMTGDHEENPTMRLGCRAILAGGQRTIEVVGPAMAADARRAHEGFWTG